MQLSVGWTNIKIGVYVILVQTRSQDFCLLFVACKIGISTNNSFFLHAAYGSFSIMEAFADKLLSRYWTWTVFVGSGYDVHK
jgi:hypothetical protein